MSGSYKASMTQESIKLANSSVLAALPYSYAEGCEGIEYREGLPRENLELLLRGEIDVALIALSDFARHGVWQALDFGVAYEKNSKTLLMISGSSFSSVSQVYYTPRTEHIISQMKVLFEARKISGVTFTRIVDLEKLGELGSEEGLLTMRDDAQDLLRRNYVVTDVAEVWQEQFGGPLVTLIWVLRPEITSVEAYKRLNAIFHRAVAAQAAVVTDKASRLGNSSGWLVEYFKSSFFHYIDETLAASIDEFFRRAERARILPYARYRNPTVPLLSTSLAKERRREQFSLADQLIRVADGSRLSLAAAIDLAERCSIIDLGMVSDYLRRQYSRKRTIKYSLSIDVRRLQNMERIISELNASRENGLNTVHLEGVTAVDFPLGYYEQVLTELKRKVPKIRVEGFDSHDIQLFAQRESLTIEQVVSRLVEAGLDVVSLRGGPRLAAEEWGIEGIVTKIARTLVAIGGELQCDLNFSGAESWNERLAFLYRLRALQDETSVISSCYVTYLDPRQESLTTDEALRLVAIARLFLDNIDNIVEQNIDEEPLLRLMGLCFGSNKVTIDMDGENPLRVIRMLKDLWGLGMAIETRQLEPSVVSYQ